MPPKELTEEEANARDMAALGGDDDDQEESDGTEESDDYQRSETRQRDPEPEPETPDPEAYLDQDRAPRRERRNSRYDELVAERDRERARAAALEVQLMSTQRPQAPPPPSADDIAAETRAELAHWQKEQMKLQMYAQTRGAELTDAEREELLRQQLEIDFQKGQVNQRHYARVQALSAPRQVDPAVAVLQAEYIDVASDQLGVVAAQRYYLQARRQGKPDTIALMRESYEAARAELQGKPFKPRGPVVEQRRVPRPDAASRARFTGTSTGGGPGGQGRVVETISKEENELAQLAYKHIKDPAARRVAYVKNVKRPAEAEDRRRRT
jgi:hypothetical protein